ncbi:hypothetical protein IEQ34_018470 [Dendrobium chrysotoxum]|uniref:cellulase n=1 Tax=Dendrobium chrysotoxum TaxID=161865 RepID=A0AAV7G457_DENCH|nr:hypothetical protein IEQ34_018470 [Dendrobium chrysotoxum]
MGGNSNSSFDDINLQLDLTGGYYDAGDNAKFVLPMAFTVTSLAWAALAYHKKLQATGELVNFQADVRWGTDYFLNTAACKKYS